MTPEDRAEIWAPKPPPAPRHRGGTEGSGRVQPPGGITSACGCKYARTGGEWQHITPCRSHQLAVYPITDEHMKGRLI